MPAHGGLISFSLLTVSTRRHSFFKVDKRQKLLGSFNCAYSGMHSRLRSSGRLLSSPHVAGDSLLPGKLFIFETALGFHAMPPASAVKVIRADDISDVSKLTVALTSAIEIRTMSAGPLLFTNFLSRDQAYDLTCRVMWGSSDLSNSRPEPVALGFSGERYLFVRINSARPCASGQALNSGMSDCFVNLSVGTYSVRSLTVENSTSPQFDTVCVFPCSVLDPATDLLTVSLYNERLNGGSEMLGDLPISLKGTKAAPTQAWGTSHWRAPSSWVKLEMMQGKSGLLPQAEVSLAVWTASSSDPTFRTARPAALMPAKSQTVRARLACSHCPARCAD